ncbi:hypothetical protein, partial [Neisseria meningitidis]|uniref:hypothetical protein n=1 Tax=Neisseria meningitidis TaxID=487 RepID=UPI001C56A4D5
KPQLDGSAEGNGDINWGDDDGSYRPEHHYGVAAPAAAWSGRRKRSVVLATAVNPNALNLPLDEPITAWAKNAQLVQQASEGTRNILGGGIPLHLPAD